MMMIQKRVIQAVVVLICISGFTLHADAQSNAHFWSANYGDSDLQQGEGVCTDAFGNVFITGTFSGTTNFGGSPLTAVDADDVFIAKFDPNGHHIWSFRFGGSGDQCGNDIVVDHLGNAIITGNFENSINFGGSPLNSSGGDDIFIAKLDPNGNHLWSASYGDADLYQGGISIAADAAANIYLSGYFGGSVNFGGSVLTSAGASDIFVVKFDSAGNHIWSKKYGENLSQYIECIAADDSGNTAIIGSFYGEVDFGGGLFTSCGGTDIYVARFDPDGNHIWSASYGFQDDEVGVSVALDDAGNAIIAGYFEGFLDIGGWLFTSEGGFDVFIAKLDSMGNRPWGRRYGDFSDQFGIDVSLDEFGNSYLIGIFSGSMNPGASPLTSSGAEDIFIMKFNESGIREWAEAYGDVDPQDCFEQAITTDISGNVIASGGLSYTADFGGGTLTSSGLYDVYVTKLYAECSGSVVYVDSAATSAGDGRSWATAFPDLQTALGFASVCDSVAEIWVAKGTYYATADSNRNAHFALQKDLEIYGGFAGWETSVSQRDISANPTILSGEIGAPGLSDNCHNVVYAVNAYTFQVDSTSVLDGFTITAGGPGSPTGYPITGAGAVFCASSNPVLRNLTITGNDSHGLTASHGWPIVEDSEISHNSFCGLYSVYTSLPRLTNVIIKENQNSGVYNRHASTALLTNVTITNNESPNGAGIRNHDSSKIDMAGGLIAENTAEYSGGGVFAQGGAGQLRLSNVTIINNSATTGGGIKNEQDTFPIKLWNSIVWNNIATTGPEINNEYEAGECYVVNSIVKGCGGSGIMWDDAMGTDGGGNLDEDPQFVDEPIGNYRLLNCSPAIEAADTTGSGLGYLFPLTDLDGNPRLVNTDLDMGPYEFQGALPGPVVYVDKTATGTGDGSSWANAYPELRDALAYAETCNRIAEIWVAAGTYTPTDAVDRFASFDLRKNLALYGGFSGWESSLEERDYNLNITILSGEIGTDTLSDNSYHVVLADGVDSTTVIDGFTITRGNANRDSLYLFEQIGGGLVTYTSSTSPTIANIRFVGNHASGNGGGLYANDLARLNNVSFLGNSAASGGAAYFGDAATLTNSYFSDNTASGGGAIYLGSNDTLVVVNSLFDGNSATTSGGAVFLSATCVAIITNSLFDRNFATDGGAIYSNSADLQLTNCTWSRNTADGSGGAIYNVSFSTSLTTSVVNSILWGDSAGTSDEIHNTQEPAVISSSLIQGCGGSGAGWDASLGTDGGNNLDADPLFVDAAGGDLQLGVWSPAINTGNNAAPNLYSPDFAGNSRIANGVVDMGAYEYADSAGAVCAIDPASIDFGSILPGTWKDSTFTITNTDGGVLSGTVGDTCSYFSVTYGAGAYTLLHDESHEVTVRFAPVEVGQDTCHVQTGSTLCGDVILTGAGLSPICQIVPAAIEFDTVLVDSWKDTIFTITNIGGGLLDGTVSDTCSQFTVASGGGAYSLENGQSHIVAVRFSPATGGADTCAVPTGSVNCADVPVTGFGLGTICATDPDAIDFGPVTPGSYLDTTVTITNLGGGLLEGDVTLSAIHYSILTGGGTFSLSHNETHTVTVRYEPAYHGAHPCTLLTGTPDCSDVPLTGSSGPVCQVYPTSIEFDTLQVGIAHDTTVTITNTGGGTLSGYVDASYGDFTVVSGSGSFSLEAGESLPLTIRFEPSMTGRRSASIKTGTLRCNHVAWLANSYYGLISVDISDPATPSLVTNGGGKGIDVELAGDFAYMVYYDSMQVFDVSDPASPFAVGVIDTLSLVREIAMSGNFIYMATGLPDMGLQIADVSDPLVPVIVGKSTEAIRGETVWVSGDYAYVGGYSIHFYTVNVSDPTNPVLVGDYITSGWIRDVQVRGNLAYLACTENLDIIDVSDPANPTLISSYDVTGSITKIALREQYVYTAGDSGLVAVNVSDPAAPWENGRYMPALQIWEHLDTRDLEIVGDYAYLAGHDMEIVNVSDPSMPVLVGEYDAINALRGGIAVEGGIECKGYGTGGTAADGPTLYAFVLGQNYPNPFNPTTTIGFTLDRNTPVTLSIYDVSGKLVRTLVEEQLPVGQYQRSWHGRDNNGQPVATGVYFYRLVAGERTETRKMVLLK